MQIVAGLSLKNLQPRVWDESSPHHLPDLQAVMVSYADFHQMPARRRKAMGVGLNSALGIPHHVKIYLDNGSFYFLRREGRIPTAEYEDFVKHAKPDWWPVPRDLIPNPKMTISEQEECLKQTMAENSAYGHDGFVPVIHISRVLPAYVAAMAANSELARKPRIGIGGIVPNLLRSPKAQPYKEIFDGLKHIRATFGDKELHLFGVGGTATLHIAALLGMDSVDSSGWRNRAARGLIQLPGSGDRLVASLGSWRGREPSSREWDLLAACECPACLSGGVTGLSLTGINGFSHRATHNLWVLLREIEAIERHLADGTYCCWIETHLDNSIYLPLIRRLLMSDTS